MAIAVKHATLTSALAGAKVGATHWDADHIVPTPTQTEAEEGALDTKAMTPLGTAQALNKQRPRGLSGFCSGKPAASEVVAGAVAPYAFSIIQANCDAKAKVAATASTVFDIQKNGTSVGSITFAAAATLATISITTAAVALDDYLTIVAPATADATLADIAFMLRE